MREDCLTFYDTFEYLYNYKYSYLLTSKIFHISYLLLCASVFVSPSPWCFLFPVAAQAKYQSTHKCVMRDLLEKGIIISVPPPSLITRSHVHAHTFKLGYKWSLVLCQHKHQHWSKAEVCVIVCGC